MPPQGLINPSIRPSLLSRVLDGYMICFLGASNHTLGFVDGDF